MWDAFSAKCLCERRGLLRGLLGAMKDILQKFDNQEKDFLVACVNACSNFQGRQREEKNGHAHPRAEDELADEEQEGQGEQGPQGPWSAATTEAIVAVKNSCHMSYAKTSSCLNGVAHQKKWKLRVATKTAR